MSRVAEAAGVGGWHGRLGGSPDPTEHGYYRQLPAWSVEQFAFLYWYHRKLRQHDERVAAGKEQRPGEMYNPALDDGR